jgi:hypothetical protein
MLKARYIRFPTANLEVKIVLAIAFGGELLGICFRGT